MADHSNWDLPVRSAYSDPEIKTLNRWVSDGGSLLLISNHMPCGGYVGAFIEGSLFDNSGTTSNSSFLLLFLDKK